MLLENRMAIVTGSAGGMGKSIALQFAREGCAVVINDLKIEGAQKVVDEIRSMGGQALAIKADISKSSEVQAMVDETIGAFGKIDILVNNAGGTLGIKGGSIDNATEEDWDRSLAVNLKGAFLVCRSVVPHMKKNKYGKIISISSMGAVHPSASVLHYHSAKAGILGLTLNLAFELAPFRIYVNAIIPGPIETPFWDSITGGTPEGKAFISSLARKAVPLGRIGAPEDIAGPALFLASGLSDYVTGQFIYVGGGQPGLSQASSFLSPGPG